MSASEDALQQRMEEFKHRAREIGLKLTHQRLEIYRVMVQSIDHPDAEYVYREVRKRIPTISLDTVYRTLWLLSDLGLVSTLAAPRGSSRFDTNLERHHHFVCVECELIRDFTSIELDRFELPDSLLSVAHVKQPRIEVKGLCLKCAARKNDRPEDQQQEDNP